MHVCFYCLFSFFDTKPKDWLGRTSLRWPILCRLGRKSQSTVTFDLTFLCQGSDATRTWYGLNFTVSKVIMKSKSALASSPVPVPGLCPWIPLLADPPPRLVRRAGGRELCLELVHLAVITGVCVGGQVIGCQLIWIVKRDCLFVAAADLIFCHCC